MVIIRVKSVIRKHHMVMIHIPATATQYAKVSKGKNFIYL